LAVTEGHLTAEFRPPRRIKILIGMEVEGQYTWDDNYLCGHLFIGVSQESAIWLLSNGKATTFPNRQERDFTKSWATLSPSATRNLDWNLANSQHRSTLIDSIQDQKPQSARSLPKGQPLADANCHRTTFLTVLDPGEIPDRRRLLFASVQEIW
jgi:hypothetical protein